MTTIKIALLGFGTVAQGTFNLLQDNAELIKNRTGVNVEISKIKHYIRWECTGMEHYLGEKLKKLRESRGWTQADLAKRLNKAVSTVSGYESDAHAIPLDVLASISSLFSISTDELLGLDAPEVLSLSGLTGAQKKNFN